MIVLELLNGIQFGITLFLMSAGLTLIFGIMGVINLAHGSLYMIGACGGAGGHTGFGRPRTARRDCGGGGQRDRHRVYRGAAAL